MGKDTSQFLTIIEEHQGIITGLCNAYYSSFEDRKDVRQEVILQLWKSFPSFRGESKLSTWLYRVSLNTILSRRRNEQRVRNTHYRSQHSKTDCCYDDDNELLNYLLSTLKDEDKAILILQLEGYKNHEIATILGLTTTNVSTRLHRIKSALRDKLKLRIYGHSKAEK
ncbi:MAG: RNA polymerase sigma factor [Bacteroidota bacterium]